MIVFNDLSQLNNLSVMIFADKDKCPTVKFHEVPLIALVVRLRGGVTQRSLFIS